ncbi:hypothetical protein Anas_03243 [Armadillidium nasatum]|uniref:Transmembrane protein n=1 Tax=Armadillidium nasatum TaxID=96803 RepID=A0A5N5T3F0_9CRUS|nr:hypothetical protein Anas_03243 [Armadillidium nasatum]
MSRNLNLQLEVERKEVKLAMKKNNQKKKGKKVKLAMKNINQKEIKLAANWVDSLMKNCKFGYPLLQTICFIGPFFVTFIVYNDENSSLIWIC